MSLDEPWNREISSTNTRAQEKLTEKEIMHWVDDDHAREVEVWKAQELGEARGELLDELLACALRA